MTCRADAHDLAGLAVVSHERHRPLLSLTGAARAPALVSTDGVLSQCAILPFSLSAPASPGLLPCSTRPSPNLRRVGIHIFTFEACSGSITLRPAGLLNRPRRPLSQGFDPASYPTGPLASYQINRQLSGWNPPPLVIYAVGAH